MHKLRIGGVPEYFNLPIHLAMERGDFEASGVDLQWHDVSQGTGRLANLLQTNELDLAVILTEGITKSILEGNPSKIVHTYVGSPLLWGVHVPANSSLSKLADLDNTTFAISRFGSGSHLIAYLLMESLGFDTAHLNFQVVDNLEGARKAMKTNSNIAFLWEKFTTNFLVEAGEFRRIGEWPTPWPCFVIAATDRALSNHPKLIKEVVEIIIRQVTSLKNTSAVAELICNRYNLKAEDVKAFLPVTWWNEQISLPEQELQKVISSLKNLGLLDQVSSSDVSFAL